MLSSTLQRVLFFNVVLKVVRKPLRLVKIAAIIPKVGENTYTSHNLRLRFVWRFGIWNEGILYYGDEL